MKTAVKSPKKKKGNKRTGIVQLPETMTWIKSPNKISKMSYDFSILQLRIFLSILVELQDQMEEVLQGKEVDQLELFQKNLGDSVRLKIAIKSFGVNPANYKDLKDAMREVATIPVELDCTDPETGKEYWVVKGLFTAYIPKEKYSRDVVIEIDKPIARYLIDTKPGWSKFMYEIVSHSNNKYTFRIYVLISSWKRKGGLRIPINDFRKMLGIEDKYSTYNDLYKRVLKPAYDELFEKADCWFEVGEVEKKGTTVTHLNFKIVKIQSEQERRLYDAKSDQVLNWCRLYYKFEDKHIKELFKMINEDTINIIHTKTAMLKENLRSQNISKLAEYVLASIRNEVAKYIEEEEIEQQAEIVV